MGADNTLNPSVNTVEKTIEKKQGGAFSKLKAAVITATSTALLSANITIGAEQQELNVKKDNQEPIVLALKGKVGEFPQKSVIEKPKNPSLNLSEFTQEFMDSLTISEMKKILPVLKKEEVLIESMTEIELGKEGVEERYMLVIDKRLNIKTRLELAEKDEIIKKEEIELEQEKEETESYKRVQKVIRDISKL